MLKVSVYWFGFSFLLSISGPGDFRFYYPFLDLVFVLCANAASLFMHVDFMLQFGSGIQGFPISFK